MWNSGASVLRPDSPALQAFKEYDNQPQTAVLYTETRKQALPFHGYNYYEIFTDKSSK